MAQEKCPLCDELVDEILYCECGQDGCSLCMFTQDAERCDDCIGNDDDGEEE